MTSKHPWQDEERLRQKYCVDGLSIQEIADKWDTSFDTIRYWKDKFDIEGRNNGVSPEAESLTEADLRTEYWVNGHSLPDLAEKYNTSESYILKRMQMFGVERKVADQDKIPEKFRNEDILSKLYWDEKKTLEEMGEIIGCSASTVGDLMERQGVDRKKTPDEMPPNHRFTINGYEQVRTKIDGEHRAVGVHQLIAIANGANPSKVFSGGKWHVHHKNGVPWDNRPANLELLTRKEHKSIHYQDRKTDESGKLV